MFQELKPSLLAGVLLGPDERFLSGVTQLSERVLFFAQTSALPTIPVKAGFGVRVAGCCDD